MYTCSICGLKKSVLGSNPEYEFRRRRPQEEEAHIEGLSDWCARCEALRFFFKCDIGKDHLENTLEHQRTNYELQGSSHRNRLDKKRQSKAKSNARNCPVGVQDILKQELLTGLMSHPLRASISDRQLRSQYADRGHRRSKSVLNESPHKATRLAKQQAIVQRCLAKKVEDLGTLRPEKHVHLDRKSAENDGIQHNDLEGEQSDEAGGGKSQTTVGRIQKMDMVNPWQEEVEKHTNQVLTSSPKRSKSSKGIKNISMQTILDYASRRHSARGASAATKPVTMEDVTREIAEMQQMESQQKLRKKLHDKRHLLTEWKRIHRNVEGEYQRVKAELDELKTQRDQAIEEYLLEKLTNQNRQKGGAQFTPPIAIAEQETEPEPVLKDAEKTIGDALDERLASMLDTLRENAHTVEPAVKSEEMLCMEPTAPVPSQMNVETTEAHLNTNQDPMPEEKVEEVAKVEESLQKGGSKVPKPINLRGSLNVLVSSVQRARFKGFPADPLEVLHKFKPKDVIKHSDPPPAQFSTLPCPHKDLLKLLQIKREVLEPNVARPLSVCRSPIFCPDTDCQRMFFVSDFNDHLKHEHPALTIERITPGRAKTFFLDTRVTLMNKAKCHMVYFVKDKLVDNSSGKYSDLLAVLVMTARIRIPELFAPNYRPTPRLRPHVSGLDSEVFLFWLCSIKPEDFKLIGTISVWPTASKPIVEHLMVHTNEVYNIRSSQKLKNLINSNRIMAIPGNLINRMTDGGDHLLAVQVQIH